MTIEIKQLIIRAVVNSHGEHVPPAAQSRAVVAPEAVRSGPPQRSPGANQETVVAACVREVLRKLERARER